MPYAVISDVHSNLHALHAVIRDMESHHIDEAYFAGDAVGYGPQPDACIEIIKDHCKILIAGNHDWAVINYTDIAYFNEHAREAILWTQNIISEEHLEDLEKFHLVKSSRDRNAFFVHATPKDPENWNYLLSLYDADVNFRYFHQPLCFLGHSHTPFIVERLTSGELLIHKNYADLKEESRYIVNVGSVGQPRDGNPRASYAIVHDHAIEIARVEYDIRKTQEEMAAVGLPYRLIERLSHGL